MTALMTSTPPPEFGAVFDALRGIEHHQLSRFPAPPAAARRAAVLIALRDRGDGPETVLVTRSSRLRNHAGQVAFPGGAVDEMDDDDTAAALREAVEETSMHPNSLHPQVVWPTLWIPVSGFAVTPVLTWLSSSEEISGRADESEIVSVHNVAISALASPQARCQVAYPNGFLGPGFTVDDLFIWGFTGLVLDRLLHFTDWEQPWDAQHIVDLPSDVPSPPDSLGPTVDSGSETTARAAGNGELSVHPDGLL